MEESQEKKHKLSEAQLMLLRKKREEKGMAAEKLSEQIGKSKGWLAQLERGRYVGIKEQDLINLLSKLYDKDARSIIEEGILEGFLNWSVRDTCIKEWYSHDVWRPWEWHFKHRDFQPFAIGRAEEFCSQFMDYARSVSDAKEKYVLWRICCTMDRNFRYSPELFLMINGIEFDYLKRLEPDQRAIEKKKLLEVFDRYQTFPRGDLNLKHDVENDQLYSEILEEGIGLIAKCNNALYQILTGVTVDDAMVEEYNGCVSRVNEYSEAYGFSKVKADAVKIEGLTRKNITMRYIPQLQNVMLDYSQKAEKSIRD